MSWTCAVDRDGSTNSTFSIPIFTLLAPIIIIIALANRSLASIGGIRPFFAFRSKLVERGSPQSIEREGGKKVEVFATLPPPLGAHLLGRKTKLGAGVVPSLFALSRDGEMLSRDGRLRTAEQGRGRGIRHLRGFVIRGKQNGGGQSGMEQERTKEIDNSGFRRFGKLGFGVTQ